MWKGCLEDYRDMRSKRELRMAWFQLAKGGTF